MPPTMRRGVAAFTADPLESLSASRSEMAGSLFDAADPLGKLSALQLGMPPADATPIEGPKAVVDSSSPLWTDKAISDDLKSGVELRSIEIAASRAKPDLGLVDLTGDDGEPSTEEFLDDLRRHPFRRRLAKKSEAAFDGQITASAVASYDSIMSERISENQIRMLWAPDAFVRTAPLYRFRSGLFNFRSANFDSERLAALAEAVSPLMTIPECGGINIAGTPRIAESRLNRTVRRIAAQLLRNAPEAVKQIGGFDATEEHPAGLVTRFVKFISDVVDTSVQINEPAPQYLYGPGRAFSVPSGEGMRQFRLQFPEFADLNEDARVQIILGDVSDGPSNFDLEGIDTIPLVANVGDEVVNTVDVKVNNLYSVEDLSRVERVNREFVPALKLAKFNNRAVFFTGVRTPTGDLLFMPCKVNLGGSAVPIWSAVFNHAHVRALISEFVRMNHPLTADMVPMGAGNLEVRRSMPFRSNEASIIIGDRIIKTTRDEVLPLLPYCTPSSLAEIAKSAFEPEGMLNQTVFVDASSIIIEPTITSTTFYVLFMENRTAELKKMLDTKAKTFRGLRKRATEKGFNDLADEITYHINAPLIEAKAVPSLSDDRLRYECCVRDLPYHDLTNVQMRQVLNGFNAAHAEFAKGVELKQNADGLFIAPKTSLADKFEFLTVSRIIELAGFEVEPSLYEGETDYDKLRKLLLRKALNGRRSDYAFYTQEAEQGPNLSKEIVMLDKVVEMKFTGLIQGAEIEDWPKKRKTRSQAEVQPQEYGATWKTKIFKKNTSEVYLSHGNFWALSWLSCKNVRAKKTFSTKHAEPEFQPIAVEAFQVSGGAATVQISQKIDKLALSSMVVLEPETGDCFYAVVTHISDSGIELELRLPEMASVPAPSRIRPIVDVEKGALSSNPAETLRAAMDKDEFLFRRTTPLEAGKGIGCVTYEEERERWFLFSYDDFKMGPKGTSVIVEFDSLLSAVEDAVKFFKLVVVDDQYLKLGDVGRVFGYQNVMRGKFHEIVK